METVSGMASDLLGAWKEMWKAAWPMFKTALSFCLWVITAIIILPCVFISGTIYPLWEDWGKKF